MYTVASSSQNDNLTRHKIWKEDWIRILCLCNLIYWIEFMNLIRQSRQSHKEGYISGCRESNETIIAVVFQANIKEEYFDTIIQPSPT